MALKFINYTMGLVILMSDVKQIYWVDVLEREPGTLDSKKVIQSYPFPDVPFEPFGFDLELFKNQIQQIEDQSVRDSTARRFSFITDIWHEKNFIRVVRKPWKYA